MNRTQIGIINQSKEISTVWGQGKTLHIIAEFSKPKYYEITAKVKQENKLKKRVI